MQGIFLIRVKGPCERSVRVKDRATLIGELLTLFGDHLLEWPEVNACILFYDSGITEVRAEGRLLWYKQPEFKP